MYSTVLQWITVYRKEQIKRSMMCSCIVINCISMWSANKWALPKASLSKREATAIMASGACIQLRGLLLYSLGVRVGSMQLCYGNGHIAHKCHMIVVLYSNWLDHLKAVALSLHMFHPVHCRTHCKKNKRRTVLHPSRSQSRPGNSNKGMADERVAVQCSVVRRLLSNYSTVMSQ